ncbi:hypothetical protein [Bradyrhizobium paxllaeri]|uniref:hypothetical protein n=1 Tax=Bradyrhizobium paxllaeri TaxID=190148 RepID=UPI0008107B5A|nr:hypothetical protein [Bradyrhizobium paxllaeri]
MAQIARKNKHSNDNSRPAKVITSPEGVKIQITAGRKFQTIRAFAGDPEITDAQFRALVCIVDRLDEGYSLDESRWGSAYPDFETLAKDIAKDERAAKRIVKELETGQRETRSGGVTKLVPSKAVLNVQRSKAKKKHNVNLYRLKDWGAFAVDASEKDAVAAPSQFGEGAVTCKEGCGDLSDGVQSPVTEGAVTAPDSTHLPTSSTHLINSPHTAPARGERMPADLAEPRFHSATRAARWPHDWMDRFWESCLKQEGKTATHKLLDEIRRKGQVSFDDILHGMKAYALSVKGEDEKYIKKPANFIKEEMWKDAASFKPRPANSNRPAYRQVVAI